MNATSAFFFYISALLALIVDPNISLGRTFVPYERRTEEPPLIFPHYAETNGKEEEKKENGKWRSPEPVGLSERLSFHSRGPVVGNKLLAGCSTKSLCCCYLFVRSSSSRCCCGFVSIWCFSGYVLFVLYVRSMCVCVCCNACSIYLQREKDSIKSPIRKNGVIDPMKLPRVTMYQIDIYR